MRKLFIYVNHDPLSTFTRITRQNLVSDSLGYSSHLLVNNSQPIPYLYSSAQANSAHVFMCGIGQIKCVELVKRVTQMNDITKHAIEKKPHFNNELGQTNLDSKPLKSVI